MENYNAIPHLFEGVEFIQLEDGNCLCFQKQYGCRVRINALTKKVLEYIDGKSTISEIAVKFNSDNECDIPVQDFFDILDGKLKKCGIVSMGDGYVVSKSSPKYLHLRMKIIPYSISSRITKRIKFLFKTSLFVPLLSFTSIIIFILFALLAPTMYYDLENLNIYDMIPIFGIGIVTVILHEFGHAAACECYGAKYGDIGFGFYLLSPCFYTDVTDVWRLKRQYRIIVNFAGIYMGNLVSIVTLILYYVSRNDVFLYAFMFQVIDVLYNLNPLAKYDGYWVLADVLDSSNLGKEAFIRVKNLTNKYAVYNKKDWFLVIYGIISPLFIVAFVLYILIANGESLLYFPVEFSLFIYHSLLNITELNFMILANYTPNLLFYILLFRFSLGIIANKIRSKKTSPELL